MILIAVSCKSQASEGASESGAEPISEKKEKDLKPHFKGSYEIVELNGVKMGMIKPTLRIEPIKNRINGNAGCNSYSSEYTVAKDNIEFILPATTKMACVQGMDVEREYIKTLKKANRYTIEKGILTLFQNDIKLMVGNPIDL